MAVLLLPACGSDTGEIRTVEKPRRFCNIEQGTLVNEQADRCASETPVPLDKSRTQHWDTCRAQAKQEICPIIVMIVTESCTTCYWTEVSAVPKVTSH